MYITTDDEYSILTFPRPLENSAIQNFEDLPAALRARGSGIGIPGVRGRSFIGSSSITSSSTFRSSTGYVCMCVSVCVREHVNGC